jgi:hypothetical protein
MQLNIKHNEKCTKQTVKILTVSVSHRVAIFCKSGGRQTKSLASQENISYKSFLKEQHRRNLAPMNLTEAAEGRNTFPERGDDGDSWSWFFSILPDKFLDRILMHAITAFPKIYSILLLTIPKLDALWCELP